MQARLMRQKTKENKVTMPPKPHLHALSPIIFLHVRHVWIWRVQIIYDDNLIQLPQILFSTTQ